MHYFSKILGFFIFSFCIITSANAALIQYTYTGMISSAPDTISGAVSDAIDYAGLFTDSPNPSGTVLNGSSFSASLIIDLAQGREVSGPDYLEFLSGVSSATVSAIITINGKSFDMISSEQYGTLVLSLAPGGVDAQVFAANTWLKVRVFSNNLPFSLSTPVALYSVTDSDTLDGLFQISEPGRGILAQGGLIPTTLSITNVVPIPSAAFLFGSGITGLMANCRRRR